MFKTKSYKSITSMLDQDIKSGCKFLRKNSVERYGSPLYVDFYSEWLSPRGIYDRLVIAAKTHKNNPREWRGDFPEVNESAEVSSVLSALMPIYRYKYQNGCTYKLTTSLVERFGDITLDLNKILCKDLLLPHSVTCVDLGDDTDRTSNLVTVSSIPVESLIITQSTVSTDTYSTEMLDYFGSNGEINLRSVDVMMYYNDLANGDPSCENTDVLMPHGNYFSLSIPDEDMTTADMIALNVGWLTNKIVDDTEENKEFYAGLITESFDYVAKFIHYLNLQQKTVVRVNKTATDIPKSSAKKVKQVLRGELFNSYIKLGSDTKYKTIKDTNAELSLRSDGSKKRPHLRRGTMAARWKKDEFGTLQRKVVWVNPSIVHKELLSKEEQEMLHSYYTIS